MNNFYIGKVESILDEEKSIIEFSIPNLIDLGKAYSLFTERKAVAGDEIFLFRMDSQLNSMWHYLKINQNEDQGFVLNYGDVSIILKDNKIIFQDKNANMPDGSPADGQHLIYGSKLKTILDDLMSALKTFIVITPNGPSTAVDPSTLAKLNKVSTDLSSIEANNIVITK